MTRTRPLGAFPRAVAWGRASVAKRGLGSFRRLLGALTSPLCVLHESVWRGGRGQARGACPASTLGVCRGLPGAPGAWLQLWQTMTFLESKMPHFLLGCEPEGCGWAGKVGMEEAQPHPLSPPPCPSPLLLLFTRVHVQCVTEPPPPVGLAPALPESTD